MSPTAWSDEITALLSNNSMLRQRINDGLIVVGDYRIEITGADCSQRNVPMMRANNLISQHYEFKTQELTGNTVTLEYY